MVDSAAKSMAEPAALSVEVKLETMDMYRFFLSTLFRRFRWFVMIALLGVSLVVFLNVRTGQWDWSWQNLLGPIILIFMAYAFLISPYFAARKYLRKNPSVAGPFMYTFSEGGIDVSGPNSQGHLNWQGIMEVRETSALFLLYPQTILAHVIPKRLLPSPDQQASMRELIRTHVKKAKLRD